MSQYSKLLGSIIGGAVGFAVMWLASHVPGITACVDIANADTCKTLGISTSELTTAVTLAASAIGTWRFPANKPA